MPSASNHAVLRLSGVVVSISGAVATLSVTGSRNPSVVTKRSLLKLLSTPPALNDWQFFAACSFTSVNLGAPAAASASKRHTYTFVTIFSNACSTR